MKYFILFSLSLNFLFTGCSENNTLSSTDNKSEEKPIFQVEVLKWYNGHKAAVSINYDGGWGTHETTKNAALEVMNRNICMDFEVVTDSYAKPKNQHLLADMREELIPNGIHFFGHGHKHDHHDEFDFDYCYNSFKTCYDLMDEWGLKPKAYAYPGSAGYKNITQLANQLAGFICARGATLDPEQYYICPDDEIKPDNWYYLPSVVMGQTYPVWIENHFEMTPIFDTALNKTAWIILMYHSVGLTGGYAYYPADDFVKDIEYIGENDFWSGNMDNIACYIQERNKFHLYLEKDIG